MVQNERIQPGTVDLIHLGPSCLCLVYIVHLPTIQGCKTSPQYKANLLICGNDVASKPNKPCHKL